MNLGPRIAKWRKAKKLSQAELAELVGVTAAAVYQWEGTKGGRVTVPTTENVGRIAAALGVSVERFFGPLPKSRAS